MYDILAQAEQVSQITGSIQGALGCLGAAIGVGIVGMKGVEAVGRNPDAGGKILVQSILGMALAEAVAFYSLFLFFLSGEGMSTLASITDTAQDIADTFGVDWPMLIAQSINFLIVAFVIWKFAFSNVLSTIKEREKQIADSLKNADRIKLELEETEKKQQETLQEASLSAKKTVTDAQDKAKAFIEGQKDDARKQAEEIISKAKIAMDLEREKVLKEAREEIASLVILTTTKVLQKELSEDDRSRFSQSAIENLNLTK